MKRLVRKRREAMVLCTWIDPQDPDNNLQSCGASIPFHPQTPCPSCGKKQVRASVPLPAPGAVIVDTDAVIVDEDLEEVVAVQALGEENLSAQIAQALRHVKWQGDAHKSGNEARLSGMVVTHSTFGYSDPVPLRRRYGCSRCAFDVQYPEVASMIYDFVSKAEKRFRQYAPGAYRRTAENVTSQIHRPWLIAGAPWTSGIINNTAALPYHKDSGNIPGSWSAMLSARKGIDGGFLHLLDYDVYLAVPHGSISIFDGQSVAHGVTPFQPIGADAYRYTLVCYAKSKMKDCSEDPSQEARRAALRAQKLQEARVGK